MIFVLDGRALFFFKTGYRVTELMRFALPHGVSRVLGEADIPI